MRVIHAVYRWRRGRVVQKVGANFYIVEWDGEGSELVPLSMVTPDPNYL